MVFHVFADVPYDPDADISCRVLRIEKSIQFLGVEQRAVVLEPDHQSVTGAGYADVHGFALFAGEAVGDNVAGELFYAQSGAFCPLQPVRQP